MKWENIAFLLFIQIVKNKRKRFLFGKYSNSNRIFLSLDLFAINIVSLFAGIIARKSGHNHDILKLFKKIF